MSSRTYIKDLCGGLAFRKQAKLEEEDRVVVDARIKVLVRGLRENAQESTGTEEPKEHTGVLFDLKHYYPYSDEIPRGSIIHLPMRLSGNMTVKSRHPG
jgi:hypothetical protein